MPQAIGSTASLCLIASLSIGCPADGLRASEAAPADLGESAPSPAPHDAQCSAALRGADDGAAADPLTTIVLSPADPSAPGAPDASADDLAVQDALDALPDGGIIYFSAGVYVLTRPIEIRSSHIALIGDGTALLVVAPPNSRLNKEGVLVNPARRIEDIAVSGLSFQVNNGASGPSSQGVIQINRCDGCLVEDVHVFWDPDWPAATPKPTNCDGIVFALGSTGWIRNAVVERIPKVGIYAAAALRPEDGTTDVRIDGCEVMHSAISGLGVGGFSRAMISGCDVHDNGIGLNIGGGDAANPRRDMSVKVLGGVFSNNIIGVNINIVASANPLPPKNIRLVNSTVVGNAGTGVVIRAAENVSLEGMFIAENGASGVAIADPNGPEVIIRDIAISGTVVYHNSLAARAPGILLQGGADRITIEGGVVADDEPLRTQRVAIQIAPDAARYYPTNVQLNDTYLSGDVPIYTVAPP